jgi:hypothetical protein
LYHGIIHTDQAICFKLKILRGALIQVLPPERIDTL